MNRTDQQKGRIGEKRGFLPLKPVADKLEHPTEYETGERDTPINEKPDERKDDQRNPDGMKQPVDRMLMIFVVLFEKFIQIQCDPSLS
jgi:hypothetical protein